MPIGDAGQSLIVLASQPRAGATLLQRILGGHPAVHTASERWIALHACAALRDDLAWAAYDHDLARHATRAMLQGLPRREDEYWEAVRRLLTHLYDLDLSASGRERLLDKTPRYYFVLDELRRVFPQAHLVLLVRHPLAVLSSLLETWVRTSEATALAGHWHDLLTAPRLLVEGMKTGDPRTHLLRYEQLVTEPAATLDRLVASLGLPPERDLAQYGRVDPNAAPWTFGDQGLAFQATEPVADRTDRWFDVLLRHPVWHALGHVYLERLGAELMADLGYNAREAKAMLGVRALDPAALRSAEAILAEPPGVDSLRRSNAAAQAKVASLEAALEAQRVLIREQEQSIAAFEEALTGRDAELVRLRAELQPVQAAPKPPATQRVWRAVMGRKDG